MVERLAVPLAERVCDGDLGVWRGPYNFANRAELRGVGVKRAPPVPVPPPVPIPPVFEEPATPAAGVNKLTPALALTLPSAVLLVLLCAVLLGGVFGHSDVGGVDCLAFLEGTGAMVSSDSLRKSSASVEEPDRQEVATMELLDIVDAKEDAEEVRTKVEGVGEEGAKEMSEGKIGNAYGSASTFSFSWGFFFVCVVRDARSEAESTSSSSSESSPGNSGIGFLFFCGSATSLSTSRSRAPDPDPDPIFLLLFLPPPAPPLDSAPLSCRSGTSVASESTPLSANRGCRAVVVLAHSGTLYPALAFWSSSAAFFSASVNGRGRGGGITSAPG